MLPALLHSLLVVAAFGQQAMFPREIDRTTAVVAAAKGHALIVHPDDEAGRGMAEQVRRAIADATAVSLEQVPDSSLVSQLPAWPDEKYRRRPMILLGNIHNNRAAIPLYGNVLVAADRDYPGGDGFTIRTVVNPYGNGVNSIFIGASGPAGLQRGVDAFAEIVKEHGKAGELILPGLLKVQLGGDDTSMDKPPAATALNYHWTGDGKLLERVVKELRAAPFMKPEVESYNPSHYGKEGVVRDLIALIQTGALSSDEITHIENALLSGLHEEYNGYWIVHGGSWLGTRHQTMGMMGFLVTADYLLNRAKPNAAAANFLRTCVAQSHAYFRQFEENYRDEGNDNASFDSAGPIGRYMMAFGNTNFFTSGASRRMALRAIMMTDSHGWFVAPGNYEDCRQGKMRAGVDTGHSVALPAFVHRDGQLKWIVENAAGFRAMTGAGWGLKSGIAGSRYPLDPSIQSVEPKEWTGTMLLPLSDYYYELSGDYMTHRSTRRAQQPWHSLIPINRAVEMIAFRDRFRPEGQYLFLSGYQGGRYNSLDANCILRYSDRGHIWLISQTEQFGHYFRNGLHIGSGHREDYLQMPGTIRLEASLNAPDIGMTATTLPHFNGADWTRHIIWMRGRFFAVIDTATFLNDADYDLTCTWRSLPPARLENGIWRADFLDSRFELHSADRVTQTEAYERGRSTEQMDVVPYVLRQHAAVKGKSGDHFSFRNVFRTIPRDAEMSFETRAIGRDGVIVFEGDKRVLIGANPTGGVITIGNFKTDAVMVVVEAETFRLAPEGRKLWFRGEEIRAGESTGFAEELQQLWEGAPHTEPVQSPLSPTPENVEWTFSGLRSIHQRIGGVNVIDPVLKQPADELFDRQIRLWSLPYPWPEGTRTVIFDLGKAERLAEIHLDGNYANYRNEGDMNRFWSERGKEPIELEFSNDGFQEDRRAVALAYDHVHRQEPPYIFKPYQYTPKNWKQIPPAGESPMNIEARYIRVPATNCYEVAFYRTLTRPSQIDRAIAIDLDGDGTQELALATEARELVILNADGSLRWKKDLENPVTDIVGIDLDQDGAEELVVADNGWHVRAYDREGRRLFQAHGKVDGFAGAFALGSVVLEGQEQPAIVVATGTGAVCLDAMGKMLGQVMGGGIVSDVVLQGRSSASRTRHRTASRNAWGSSGWHDVRLTADGDLDTGERLAGGIGCWWWLGLGYEYWPEEGAPDAAEWRDGLAVFVARAGVNAYGLGDASPEAQWSFPASGPVSAYTFANMDGTPGRELVLGRLDGFIHVINRKGKVIKTWPTGGPVRDICALDADGETIAVGMTDQVQFVDAEGRIVKQFQAAADRLTVLKRKEQVSLLCVVGQGKVLAVPVQ